MVLIILRSGESNIEAASSIGNPNINGLFETSRIDFTEMNAYYFPGSRQQNAAVNVSTCHPFRAWCQGGAFILESE